MLCKSAASAARRRVPRNRVCRHRLVSRAYAEASLPLDGAANTDECKLTLDAWVRRVVDPARPSRAVFVLPVDLNGDRKRDIVAGAWWYRNPGSLVRRLAPKDDRVAPRTTWRPSPTSIATAIPTSWARRARVPPPTRRSPGRATTARVPSPSSRTSPPPATGNFLQGVAVARFSSGGPLEVALSWAKIGSAVQRLRVPVIIRRPGRGPCRPSRRRR